MRIDRQIIELHNAGLINKHQRELDIVFQQIQGCENIINQLITFQVAIPSWALGTGGTRFEQIFREEEPRSLEEKD